ncbi:MULTISPECIES: hypothetical protein [Flavobacterium]|uniref:hypothetical protein n=1 Tax=Flavobacterium TaxID=237 RepID=UPI001FCB8979|nr:MULTISPECIES: hypothetical protein [Flavobacterium]UOK42232.1 hypothetical protein LZF87_13050 [Flavobacterium enshiense]
METTIFKSKVSFLTIGFGLIGAVFMIALSLPLLLSKWVKPESSDNVNSIICWSIISCFWLVALSCLYILFNVKTFTLTNKNLIISRPLLFLSLKIPLENIKNINEEDYEINSTANSRKINVYNGEKMTLELQNGKKVIFTSFEISEYDDLVQNLKNIKLNVNNNGTIKNDRSNKFQFYPLLLFLIILTIIIIFSLIKKK